MKTHLQGSRFLPYASVSLIVLGLIAWSPPAGDHIVQIGSSNTTGGHINPPQTIKVSAFRGYIGGNNNLIGSNGFHSVILGSTNTGNSYSSFVGGSQNQFAVTGNTAATSVRMMGLFGSNNVVGDSRSHLLVCGNANTVHASTSIVSGSSNMLGSTALQTGDSATIGYFNQVSASMGWAIGDTAYVLADGGMALGTGVRAEKPTSTALGRYNDEMLANEVLAIGSGSDGNNRFTALRVTNDGGVILGRAQGDISMGQYGN